ncbi:hypothetical protein Xhom_04947 [Xenorhabdus hominickii]|uniref:Uncharacterized protein n=1 Tax=Xenorhabdus hominickii TaxID=351679 RepID=A0A2G0PWF7_XENHO|nr:hypothetical protein Xhom_04947 [Xenorhabdus hominickii]
MVLEVLQRIDIAGQFRTGRDRTALIGLRYRTEIAELNFPLATHNFFGALDIAGGNLALELLFGFPAGMSGLAVRVSGEGILKIFRALLGLDTGRAEPDQLLTLFPGVFGTDVH